MAHTYNPALRGLGRLPQTWPEVHSKTLSKQNKGGAGKKEGQQLRATLQRPHFSAQLPRGRSQPP